MKNELTKRLSALLLFVLLPLFSGGQATEATRETVDIGAAYTGELWGNVRGGTDRGVRYMDNLDITAEIDLMKAIGWRGGTMFLYGLGNQGGSISELAGDYQAVSNIEAENSWRLYEAWFEKVIRNSGVSVLGGLYDVNSEFNALSTAQLFINSSHGIGAAMGTGGVTGPSIFPLTSLGLRVKLELFPSLIVQAAAVDGVPSDPGNTRGTKIHLRKDDGWLLTGEIGLMNGGATRSPRSEKVLARNADPGIRSKIALGGWHYTRETSSLRDPLKEGRQQGLYIIAEIPIYSESKVSRQGLELFARGEVANGEFTPVTGYAGGGAVYRGLLPGRGSDRVGLAAAHALRSPYYVRTLPGGRATGAKAETNLELTYLAVLSEHLRLQYDLQFIVRPHWGNRMPAAWVNGVRLMLEI